MLSTIDSYLISEKERITNRYKEFKRKQKFPRIIFVIGLICSFILMALLIVEKALVWVETGTIPWDEFYSSMRGIEVTLTVIPLFVGMLILDYYEKKNSPLKPSSEEQLFLDIYSIIENLSSYMKFNKEFDRQIAIKNIVKANHSIQDWGHPELEMFNKLFESHIEPFRKVFQEKIIGAIKKGDPEEVQKTYSILKELCKYLLDPNPNLDKIDSITLKIDKNINSIDFEGKEKSQKSYLKNNLWLRHILFFSIIVIVGCITGFISVCLGGPIWTAYGLAVTVIMGISLAYIKYWAQIS